MLWSPFDATALAEREPATTFVVAAIGFETTAPAFALLLEEAEARGLKNIKLLTSLKSALAAIEWVCAAGEAIDAFLCPGHVSVVTGTDAYVPLAEKYGKPFIVAGFEGKPLLAAVRAAVEDAAEGRGGVRNLYPEAVSAAGNIKAREITDRYFELDSEEWRGLGSVAESGFFLREAYRSYDAGDDCIDTENMTGSRRPETESIGTGPSASEAEETEASRCRCGDVILGRIDPGECPLFRNVCTPTNPIGPCMVSSEGACGYWYRG